MIICFLTGLFIGGLFGYALAAAMAMSGRSQDWEDRKQNERS